MLQNDFSSLGTSLFLIRRFLGYHCLSRINVDTIRSSSSLFRLELRLLRFREQKCKISYVRLVFLVYTNKHAQSLSSICWRRLKVIAYGIF